MKAEVTVFAPLAFAGMSYLLWLGYREDKWRPRFAKMIIRATVIALGMYVVSFVASLIGDKIHGPRDSFDWSPVYVVTLPMMFIGWFGTLTTLIVAAIGAIVGSVSATRNRSSEPSGGAYR